MNRRPKLLAALAIASGWLAAPVQAAEPLSLSDYMALHGPAPTEHIAYGAAPLQYVEWFEPTGSGPFPVVVLIHGGCFLNQFDGVPQMRGMAGALAAKGVAVWNVEYRGLDTPGGGYPGTFLDVQAAVDLVEALAKARHLDTNRLAAVGHSAGGVLALWAAGRARLPASSPLYEPHPLPVRKVVALGSSGDLHALATIWNKRCEIDVAQLTGSPTQVRPDVYADTSPLELAPNGSDTLLVVGDHDTILKPAEAAAYASHARERGDAVETLVLPNASHFDEVAVTSPSWHLTEAAILKVLGIH